MKNNESSLTSLISAFSRAYHVKEDCPIIFNDYIAQDFLSPEEYQAIAVNMSNGITFFSSEMAEKLKGDQDAILKWVTQIQLSPTPLARAAYAENVVRNECQLGAEQYVIMGAGLDTFAWRYDTLPNVTVYEVDHPSTQKFKIERLEQAGYEIPAHLKFVAMDFTKELSLEKLAAAGLDLSKKTVFSLLGVSYYLTKDVLQQLLHGFFKDLSKGSSIIFDFADEGLFTEPGIFNRVQNMVQMAQAAGEPMKFAASLAELEDLLANEELLIYEHLSPQKIQQQFFSNRDDNLQAFETIHYIHAVKK
ncbi:MULTISPECIES: class I SAM-dependent methyltransferase [Niallia]|uniref:class I SAM-dependent methyltransferase n=1 Tax=Niallia TaxID=2837506 RepID=UPI00077C6A42|nr:class I SAM-dependent methyltransferase [Niallia circulans]MDR4315891.1 class I SAM-dependent methyltransferase [Niallia circulans]MED3841296.1 class I SAM-dependent methyltransferase [Niallia circulans]MED4244848.1 class I SAM-dependent methyltransferase [Niallia circulans]MED4249669.1 class I SAM-dependent methyltransferase [Niallia circulans]QKH60360.1 class I SAM-dependent methyltransferase [Niallia circulans]